MILLWSGGQVTLGDRDPDGWREVDPEAIPMLRSLAGPGRLPIVDAFTDAGTSRVIVAGIEERYDAGRVLVRLYLRAYQPRRAKSERETW